MAKLLYYPSSKQKDASDASPTVLLIHGLERLPYTMSMLGWRFQQVGWNVLQYVYPCHHISFYEAKDRLRDLLRELPKEQFPSHAIGFSMGGVILGELLKEEPCISRIVLLGSPLIHSQAAERTLLAPFSRKIFGPSLEALAEEREITLPSEISVAAIAGFGPVKGSWNPLLEGENDGIVRVREALPSSIATQTKISAPHIGLVLQPKPFSLMHHFLQTGTLLSDGRKQTAAGTE